MNLAQINPSSPPPSPPSHSPPLPPPQKKGWAKFCDFIKSIPYMLAHTHYCHLHLLFNYMAFKQFLCYLLSESFPLNVYEELVVNCLGTLNNLSFYADVGSYLMLRQEELAASELLSRVCVLCLHGGGWNSSVLIFCE